jgi:hypothetical protein
LHPAEVAGLATVKNGPSVFSLSVFGGRRFESDASDGVPATGERRERCAAGLMTMSRRAVVFSTLASQGKSPNQALLPTSTAVTSAASHLSRQP